jgi:hypothetical protein
LAAGTDRALRIPTIDDHPGGHDELVARCILECECHSQTAVGTGLGIGLYRRPHLIGLVGKIAEEMIRAEADQPLLDAIGTQWNPFLAEGSRSRTYQEASDAPSWV